ncbi:Uncharacterised protein [uncultured archaeon]|nr:Uncharacterised protein [uncultured archaeon]
MVGKKAFAVFLVLFLLLQTVAANPFSDLISMIESMIKGLFSAAQGFTKTSDSSSEPKTTTTTIPITATHSTTTLLPSITTTTTTLETTTTSISTIACPKDCSSHGSCDEKTGVCLCVTGYSGIDCSISSTGGGCVNKTLEETCKKPNMYCSLEKCVCNANYANCNMITADGCETNTLTDTNNCGTCGLACISTTGSMSACVAGKCVTTKKPNGETCAADKDCASGNCLPAQTGKRCASKTSCWPCQVINTTGTECVDATAGTDPKKECDAEDESTCGKNGQCDGRGNCQMYPSGVVCSDGSCSNNRYNFPGTCNGEGKCVSSRTENCNDGNPCTEDSCSSSGCVNLPLADETPCGSQRRCRDGDCV